MPLTPPESRPSRKRKRPVHKHDIAREPSPQRLHTSRWSPPPAFYDNLSQVPLCRQVLREFDRRTRPVTHRVPPSSRDPSHAEYQRLKRFARRGGPSLDHIRAYPGSGNKMPPRPSLPSDGSRSHTSDRSRSRTGRSSAYNPAFEQSLVDHGIFPHGYDHGDDSEPIVPGNLSSINDMLAKPRASLSSSTFTSEDFRKFEKSNNQARTESKVMSTTFPIIIGNSDIPSQQNIKFGSLAPLTDGSLTVAQPDFYDGCRPEDLGKSIRDELSDYIVPSTNSSNPILPNFFAEAKGSGGNTSVSKLQACYDAAIGARAIHSLRMYIDPDTAIDGNAYTISATYQGGSGGGALKLFATHAVESTAVGKRVEYHMTQINGWDMTSNSASFRQGAAAVRNAREWAQGQRASLITAASAKPSTASAQSELGVTSQSNTAMQEADMSADELTSDHRLHQVSSGRSLSSTSRSRTTSTAQGKKPKRRRTSDQD